MLQILYLTVLLSPTTAMSDAPDIVSHRVALSYNSNVWCSRYCISSCCSLLQQQCLMLQILYLIVLLSPPTAMRDAPDIVSHRVALSSNSNVWCSRYCISSCCSLLQQQCLMLQILYLIVLLSPTTAMSDAPDIVSHRVALSSNSNAWCSRYCISSCCSLLQQQCLMLQILYLIVLLSPPTAMSDAPDIVSHRVALSSNSNVWCSIYCISSCCSLLQQQCLMLQILYLIVLLSPPTAMSDAPDIVSHRVALSYNSNVWCSRYCISSCCSLLQQQCLMLQILYLIVLLSPTTAMSDAPDIVSHRVALSSNSNVWCSRYCISSCCSLLQQQCLMLQILYLIVLLSPPTAMSDAPDIVSHRVALSSNSNAWCSRYCISPCCSLLQQQCLMLQILYLTVLLSPPTAMSDAPDIVSHRVALSYNSNVWCSRYCISSCCSLLQQQCLMLHILYLIVLLSPTTAMSDAPDIVSHRVALSSNSNVWCSRYCISSCCSLLQQQCVMLQILYLTVLLSPPTAMYDAPDIVSHRVALSYNSNVWCSRYCISSCCSLLQQQCLMLQILYLIVLLSPTTAMSDAPYIVSHRVALSYNSNVWCSRYCISSCCSLLQQQCLMLQILYLIVLLSPTTAMRDAPDIVSHRVALSYNSNVWCSRYCISSCCSLLQQQCLMLQILYLIVLLSPPTAMSDAPDIVSHRVALSYNSNAWCSRYCISSCCSLTLLQQQCLMLQILYLIVLLSPPTAMSDAPDIVSHRVALSSNSNVWCSRYCISSCCSLLQQQCLMLQILYLIVLLSPTTAMSDAPDIVSHRVALSYNSNVWCSIYCISCCSLLQQQCLMLQILYLIVLCCSLLQQQCMMLHILYLTVLLSPPTAMSDAPDIVSHRVALSYNSNAWCSRYCISSCCSLLQQQCLMLQILYLIVLLSPTTAMSDAPDIVSHRVALSSNSNVWCSRYCISSCCSLLQQQCLMLQILYLIVLLSPTTAMSDAPDIVSHRVALSYNSNVWCSRYCISSCCSLLQQQCLMLQILYLIVLLSPPTAMSDAPDIVSHRVALSSNSNVWCSRYCISSCCSLLQQQCLMLQILYLIVLLSPPTAMSDAPDIVSHRVALSSNSNVWCSRYCISSCCSLLQQQCLMLQILYLIVLLSPTTAMSDAPSHRVALSSNSNVWCSRYCISSCCSLLQQQCLMLVSHRVALSSNSNVWCSRYCISSCCSLLSDAPDIVSHRVATAMSDAPDIVSHRVALSSNSNVWCSRYCISSCCSLLQQQCLMLQILYLIVLLSPPTAMSDAPDIVSHRVALS